MSSFDPSTWDETTVDDNQNDNPGPPEPGDYEVVLTDARAITSKAGDDYVILSFTIAVGAQAGYQWDDLRSFKNEGAVKATKATCARIGLDVASVGSLQEIEDGLKAFVGEWYLIKVKQNGDYRNVYVNERLPAKTPPSDVPSDPAAFAVPAGAPADDNIPF